MGFLDFAFGNEDLKTIKKLAPKSANKPKNYNVPEDLEFIGSNDKEFDILFKEQQIYLVLKDTDTDEISKPLDIDEVTELRIAKGKEIGREIPLAAFLSGYKKLIAVLTGTRFMSREKLLKQLKKGGGKTRKQKKTKARKTRGKSRKH